MKKILFFITLLSYVFLFVSCQKVVQNEQFFTLQNLGEPGELQNENDFYQLFENPFLGYYSCAVKCEGLVELFNIEGNYRFNLLLDEKIYTLKMNPFNHNLLEVDIPDCYTVEEIVNAPISVNYETEINNRDNESLSVAYVIIQKETIENNTDLYEIRREDFTSLRNAGLFVFDSDDVFITPSYVKNSERNCYSTDIFLAARNVVDGSSVHDAFLYLKESVNHEMLLEHVHSNRVVVQGSQIVIEAPLINARYLKDLGPEGSLSNPENVYNIVDSTDILGVWSISVNVFRLPEPEKFYPGWKVTVGATDLHFIENQFDSCVYEVKINENAVDSLEAIRNLPFGMTDGNEKPLLSKVSGPEGKISTDTAFFDWQGSDVDGSIEFYEYKLNSENWQRTNETSLRLGEFLQGLEYTLYVRAKDDYGSYSNVINWIFKYSESGYDFYEEDDIWQDAKPITDSEVQERVLSDVDWACFDITGIADITISTENLVGADTEIFLYDGDLNELDSNDDYVYSTDASKISRSTLETGRYYVKIVEHNAENSSREYSDEHTYDLKFVIDNQLEHDGKFKIANSWGKGGWENIDDGFLFMTYASFLEEVDYIYVSEKNYTPTRAIATFQIEQAERDQTKIELRIGDTSYPDRVLYFVGNDRAYVAGAGDSAYPGNIMVMDITDVLPLESEDISLYITSSSHDGTITSFCIEVYDDYSEQPVTTCSATDLPKALDSYNVFSTIEALQIEAVPSRFGNSNKMQLAECSEAPNEEEIKILKKDLCRDKNGQENNFLIGNHGTGLRLPDEFELDMLIENKTLCKLTNFVSTKEGTSVDHSLSPYFPPIGDQAEKGSCSSFATIYYSGTYYNAMRYDYDLSGIEWVSKIEDGYDHGGPSEDGQDKILSPDFAYVLLNEGVDDGSVIFDNIQLLHQTGVSSWEKHPYDVTNLTSWPNEGAWRDAPNHRLNWKSDWEMTYYVNRPTYYMKIESLADIRAAKDLLKEGYLITIGVDGYQYEHLDENDTWTTENYSVNQLNHANTIVGFFDD